MSLRPIDKSLDSIKVQSGELLFVVEIDQLFNQFDQGVVPFINQFGKLYYGNLTKQQLYSIFQNRKQQLIHKLITFNDIVNVDDIETVEFGLQMCHMSRQTLQWNWPATVNNLQGRYVWNTGNNRLLCTGLSSEKNAYQKLKVLCLDNKINSVEQFLENPVEIHSDQQLNEIFDLDFDSNQSHKVILRARLVPGINGHNLKIEIVSDGAPYCQPDYLKNCLTNYLAWKKLYGSKPQLHVYTDWPELLSNFHHAWDLIHAGPSALYKTDRPGFSERQLRFYTHEQNPGFVKIYPHTLFMLEPTPLDVAELLFWVDLDHSTYIGNNYQYLLYRQSEYKTTFINTSIPTQN